jgi:hypothetical protein
MLIAMGRDAGYRVPISIYRWLHCQYSVLAASVMNELFVLPVF